MPKMRLVLEMMLLLMVVLLLVVITGVLHQQVIFAVRRHSLMHD